LKPWLRVIEESGILDQKLCGFLVLKAKKGKEDNTKSFFNFVFQRKKKIVPCQIDLYLQDRLGLN
jgi:hypothetical protein